VPAAGGNEVACLVITGLHVVDADEVVWSSVKGDARATCTFTLVGGPAQVSVEMLTNGVSVGTAGFSGDVNKVLTAGDCAWSRYTCRAGVRELVAASADDTYRSGLRFYLPIQ